MRRFLLSARTFAPRTFVPGFLLFVVSVTATAQTLRPMGQGALTVGQAAPEFTLVAQDGSDVSLSSLRGQYIVLFFYPSAADAGSIAEVKAFEEDLTEYDKRGTVLGVATATEAQQAQLATSEEATFPLLSDAQGKTAQAYRSLGSNGAASRNAFLIDPQGKIAQVWTSVQPSTISSTVSEFLSLKPPVGGVSPIRMSLKPPIPQN
jgi:peroxiredoxin Q/BCP